MGGIALFFCTLSQLCSPQWSLQASRGSETNPGIIFFPPSPILPNFKSQLCLVSHKAFVLQPCSTEEESERPLALAVRVEATLPGAWGWKETQVTLQS